MERTRDGILRAVAGGFPEPAVAETVSALRRIEVAMRVAADAVEGR